MAITDLGPDYGSAGEIVSDRFRLMKPLGSGSMGIVWLATDLRLRRRVAMKMTTADMPHELRSQGEASAAASVSDDSCVRVYDDFVDHYRRRWVVMEALEGDDLAKILKCRHHLSLSETVFLGLRMVRALDAVHSSGLVHRDVKPANIFLCNNGRIVLIDFGIAVAGDRPRSEAGEFAAGSLAYLAPEILGGGTCSPASDLYALGVTLLTAATGPVAVREGTNSDAIDTPYRRPAISVAAGPLRGLVEDLLSMEPSARPNLRETGRRLKPLAAPQAGESSAGLTRIRRPRRHSANSCDGTHGPNSGRPRGAAGLGCGN